jgi:tetratricopeptide (TPR) repeat protein
MGERDYLSTACAYLGRALADQGKDVEAETWAARSKELATPDDLPSQIGWRLVVARVLARRGEREDAEALAREALAMAETTDDRIDTGGALVDLAEVLHAGGEAPGEVRSCIERAVELFENKGAVAPAERARAWLAAVEAGSS